MKTPFYRHTSLLLAVAFTAGIAVGSITDSLDSKLGQGSILQRSPFIQELTRGTTVPSYGEVLAYDVYEGDLVPDRIGDDESASDTVTPVIDESLPVPDAGTIPSVKPLAPLVSCEYTAPEKPLYKATALSKTQSVSLDTGDTLRISILYKNEGNTTWFSENSGCKNVPVAQLGTMQPLDRASYFQSNNPDGGWAATNRVVMSTPRVNPGSEALFTFDIKAPSFEDIYREVFGVVLPGVTWIKNSESSLEITVGDPYDDETAAKVRFYMNGSGYGSAIDLLAEKKVEIDLSEQKAVLKLGDYVVREFRVSSGAPKTPTPVGTWKVLFKQQVRIGGASPFYIMPKWQAIRPDGYGFHALPSLGNASLRARIRALGPDKEVPTDWFTNDAMWSEALDHIGSPRSHGCVRFLPDDAAYVYDFTDVGTPVVVVK